MYPSSSTPSLPLSTPQYTLTPTSSPPLLSTPLYSLCIFCPYTIAPLSFVCPSSSRFPLQPKPLNPLNPSPTNPFTLLYVYLLIVLLVSTLTPILESPLLITPSTSHNLVHITINSFLHSPLSVVTLAIKVDLPEENYIIKYLRIQSASTIYYPALNFRISILEYL